LGIGQDLGVPPRWRIGNSVFVRQKKVAMARKLAKIRTQA
jgi:hypothetical protein